MTISLKTGFKDTVLSTPPTSVAAIIPVEDKGDFTEIDGQSLIGHAIDEAREAGISDIVLACNPEIVDKVEQARFGQTKGGNVQFVGKDAASGGMASLIHAARNCLEDGYETILYSHPRDLIVTDPQYPNALRTMLDNYDGTVMLGTMQPDQTQLFRGRALMPVDFMETIRNSVATTRQPGLDLHLKDMVKEYIRDNDEKNVALQPLPGQHFDFRNADSVAPATVFTGLMRAEVRDFSKSQETLRKAFPTWWHKESTTPRQRPLSEVTAEISHST